MGKCTKCGKKGLFLKVNAEGLCKDCETEKKKQALTDEINANIEWQKKEMLALAKIHEEESAPPVVQSTAKVNHMRIVDVFKKCEEDIARAYRDRDKPGMMDVIIALCKEQIDLWPQMERAFNSAKKKYEKEKVEAGYTGELNEREEIRKLLDSTSKEDRTMEFEYATREDAKIIAQYRYEQGEYDKETLEKKLAEINSRKPPQNSPSEKMEKIEKLRKLEQLHFKAEGPIHFRHRGFTQLCIIRDKEGNWEEVYQLAMTAKAQGWYIDGGWDKRIEKARTKLGQET
jgi:hypothetical protein